MAASNPEACSTEEPVFTCVTKGLLGAEGPVFSRIGEFYMVAPEVEQNGEFAGQILKVDLETKEPSVLCSPSVDGYGGIPAGCQFDRHGNLFVADMRLGILKVNVKDGSFEQLFKVDSSGDPMQGCNDCSLDYHGNLWVTGPAKEIAPAPYERSFEDPFGSVYCMTSDGKLIKVATGFYFCNGLAVQHSADGKPQHLLVAETPTKTIWCFDIVEPGNVTNKRIWGKLPDEGHEGGPDGMDFDSEGRLLVANWGLGHLEVFSADGMFESRVKCSFDKPSNLHFKPKSNEVYVTEHTFHGLWCFKWKTTGRVEACEL